MILTPQHVKDLLQLALAAEAETDDTQPDDIDALSPKADRISSMHAALTPAVVLALLKRITWLEGNAMVAAAELRHTYGHVALGQAINVDIVARVIRMLEEASAPRPETVRGVRERVFMTHIADEYVHYPRSDIGTSKG